MAWVDAVIDRTQADIQNKTAKGYLNVADWERIDGNTTHVRGMFHALRRDLDHHALTAPTRVTIPFAITINRLAENIDRLRQYSYMPAHCGVVELKFDYLSGLNGTAPDYEDVNDWERDLELLRVCLFRSAHYTPTCGVSQAGQSRLWQVRFRLPFVEEADAPVRRGVCGIGRCGVGIQRNNRYRRYNG